MNPPEALTKALRTFVQEAAAMLTKYARAIKAEPHVRWERGNDGFFQRKIVNGPVFRKVLGWHKAWDRLQVRYVEVGAQEQLLADHHAGKQVTKHGAQQYISVELGGITSVVGDERILFSLAETAVTPEGRFLFDASKFDALWSTIWESLIQEEVPYVLLAPLPAFYCCQAITLAPGLVIDRFTEDEVKRCLTDGLIRVDPWSLSTPSEIVGIRWLGSARKLVEEVPIGSEPKRPEPSTFGCRQPASGHRLVDDVLTLLRLFQAGSVWSPGSFVSFKSWIPYPAPRFRPGPKVGGYALDERDIAGLQGLWNSLSKVVNLGSFLDIGLRRFNFAFDRFETEDRIVDLLIGAESLFLRDSHWGPKGEPMAKRACRSIKHSTYTEDDVYDVMRRAYDLRNGIVHGNAEKNESTHLPGKSDASLEEFTYAVEEIMRLSLRKAIDETEAGKEFGTREYWKNHPA